MPTNGKCQLEEYRHRIENEVYRLNKVNAEVVSFLDKGGYLESVFFGIRDYKDRLFKSLGANDHRMREAYGKDLMQDLWETELGLGPYPFAEILSKFEFAGKFHRNYRDHVLHQLSLSSGTIPVLGLQSNQQTHLKDS